MNNRKSKTDYNCKFVKTNGDTREDAQEKVQL